MIVTSLAAYGYARLTFRGKNGLFAFLMKKTLALVLCLALLSVLALSAAAEGPKPVACFGFEADEGFVDLAHCNISAGCVEPLTVCT